jgi:hypothetical protein
METWEKEKMLCNWEKENEIYSYILEKNEIGELTLTDFEMDCIINGRNTYDEKLNMEVSSLNDLWFKIPKTLQLEISAILSVEAPIASN